jgi:hypothetical protein
MSKRISKSFALNATDLFAPWVPVTAQNALKQSPLYLPFLKVYSKTKLRCVEITHNNDRDNSQITVHLGLPNNLRVAYIGMSGGNFRICSYDTPDALPRFSTHLGNSEKCMYLVNRILNSANSAGATFDRALSTALNYHNHIANNMGRAVTNHLREKFPASYSVMSDINSESATWLIKRYFNDVAEADIPSRIRDAINKAHSAITASRSNHSSNVVKLGEFFDREKWMFGYGKDVGYFIGAAHFKHTFDNYSHIDSVHSIADDTNGCDMTMPIEYYRTFQDIPEDIRKSLLASVAMTKMYLEGGTNRVDYYDPERLIPSSLTLSIDANSCSDSVHGMGAYWMLVDRI